MHPSLWGYIVPSHKVQCKWQTCLASLQFCNSSTDNLQEVSNNESFHTICFFNRWMYLSTSFDHKKQRHSASVNYAITPNNLDTERISQNLDKAFTTKHDQTSMSLRFWHSTYRSYTIDINFQIALATEQLINWCRLCFYGTVQNKHIREPILCLR